MRYIPTELFQQMSDKSNLFFIQKGLLSFPHTYNPLQFPRIHLFWASKFLILLTKAYMISREVLKIIQKMETENICFGRRKWNYLRFFNLSRSTTELNPIYPNYEVAAAASNFQRELMR